MGTEDENEKMGRGSRDEFGLMVCELGNFVVTKEFCSCTV